MSILIWLISFLGESLLGIALRKMVGRILGRPLDEFEKEVDKAIESARRIFHNRYGDHYGAPSSTFIDIEKNKNKLLQSTFPRGKRLTAADLNLRGFPGVSYTPEEVAEFFLYAFYDAIGRTSLRALDRDLSLQDASRERSEILQEVKHTNSQFQLIVAGLGRNDIKLETAYNDDNFPIIFREAISEPSLQELSKLMKAGQAEKALAYTKRHLNAIDVALKQNPDPKKHYAKLFLSYRQRLLFAAATVSSWHGNIKAGRAYWWEARELGPIDPKWHEQAVITTFNIGLKDQLHLLVKQMDQNSKVYQKIVVPCLAYLEKDWPKLDRLLSGTRSADLLLQRVEARLQFINFQDTETVKLTAELIDKTDDDYTFPVVNLIRAQLTLDLLQRVVREYTPLGYDRLPLVNNLVNRINVAIDTTEPDSLFQAQAIGCLGMAAELLRDDELSVICTTKIKALNEDIRSSIFFEHDPELSPEKIDALFAKDQITLTQAALLKAELYQASGQLERVERELYEALFATPNKRQRSHVLRRLAQHLSQLNRVEEAQRLIDATPLRPADKWLARTENLPAGKTPLDLVDEVESFLLDVDVIDRLAQVTQSIVTFTSPENSPPDYANLERAEEAVRWTALLVKVLPSRSSQFRYAWALYAARHYERVIRISCDLDSVYAEETAELKALALFGLGQRSEAIDSLISAGKKYPKSSRFDIHAARFLLIENRPEDAASLLEPHIDADSKDPECLIFYALAIRARAPSSRETASKALDFLIQAYKMRPDSKIAWRAWHAARTAGREEEIRPLFKTIMEDTPAIVVETEEDLYHGIRTIGENRGVLIKGGLKYLAKMFQEDRKRSESLGDLLRAHVLSYTDFFRLSGRSWELWSHWTEQFKQRSSRGEMSPGGFSVLDNWPFLPLNHDRQNNGTGIKLFLDQTAILTLGVLGPRTAKQILKATGKCYIHAGIIQELGQDLTNIEGYLLGGHGISYVEAANFLRQRSKTIVPYSEEIESSAPSDSGLGPSCIDLGVAIQYDALYVSDIDNSEDWPEEAKQVGISSAVLLASLNKVGEIPAKMAEEATKKRPHTFKGWNTATTAVIPEVIVFDELSILDWVTTGLVDVLGSRIKVGPWAWVRISEESHRQAVMELAHERIKGTIRVLKESLNEGILDEVEYKDDPGTHTEVNGNTNEEDLRIEEFWFGALRTLRTAQAQGCQLWADDRFYSLLLIMDGPRKTGPMIEGIRAPFNTWVECTPPISTMEVLDQLGSAGKLSSTVAQDAAASLFSQGYRIAHPLLLAHVLREYPVPEPGQLTSPYEKLVRAIIEIPYYLNETCDTYYGNREGFIRMASIRVAESFIAGVWEAENLSDDERCVLTDSFLEAIEKVFRDVSFKSTRFQSDLDPILFWRALAHKMRFMSVEDERSFILRYNALRWLGNAAAKRSDQSQIIVRILEDYVLDSLKTALRALDEFDEWDRLSQVMAIYVIPTLIPLTDTALINIFDPLMRRTVGSLAGLDRDGCISTHFYATSDREQTPLEIPEEQKEEVAAEIVGRAAAGDLNSQKLIHATDVVFSYPHQVPKEWIDEGFPADEPLRINVRCPLFTLLWADPPGLREIIIHLLVDRLSEIDPSLAYQISQLEDNILSEDPNKVQEAREIVALSVLQSGYFDLQRDLVHAMQRIRQYDGDVFAQFLGRIGEEPAQSLVNYSSKPNVCLIGNALVPLGHFLGRAFLTAQFDDEQHILEYVRQMTNIRDNQDEEHVNGPTLAEWLANNASIAENADDPFVAAWALRTVLLGLSAGNQDPELNINESAVKASDWVAGYLMVALAPKARSSSEVGRRMIDRRRLASATLLLASFACGGKSMEAYNPEEDPQTIWLDQVWLLASKLQIALVGLQGGVSNAANIAAQAVRNLELDPTDIPVLDSFNPFAFGSRGDDIGIALTLTAVLKVVLQLPNPNERPIWLTDPIRGTVKELANTDSDSTYLGEGESNNRLGLAAPLRVQFIAQRLATSLDA
ncbi:MAG: hypothetical protein F4120_04670 [Rhodothermaceae bacterium]|nr:hypothetical protein [Rhodothermaceae bacterium]MYC03198.1 hypothetical protein [Rhodothermaceae bacterium]MYI16896.1 hypothetical protein [Rhodothermaceae bacterium]